MAQFNKTKSLEDFRVIIDRVVVAFSGMITTSTPGNARVQRYMGTAKEAGDTPSPPKQGSRY